MEVNVHEAKTHLSKLLTRVAAGEEVTICRYGRPVVKLVSCQPEASKREGGADRGLFRVPVGFDKEIPEVTRAFHS